MKPSTQEYDLFISHASEDKDGFVRPLATLLLNLGVKVSYDEFSLKVGDSLSRSIDQGLAQSRFGVVVLSKAFLSKNWPEYELRGLVTKEIEGQKTILPIWHGISKSDLLKYSPPLADKIALTTDRSSVAQIALNVLEVVRPEIFQGLARRAAWKQMVSSSETVSVPMSELKPGPIRHTTLPESMIVRIKIFHHVLSDVFRISLKDTIDNFRRDVHPEDELKIWERITATYLEAINGKNLSLEGRSQIFSSVLRLSFIPPTDGAASHHRARLAKADLQLLASFDKVGKYP